MLFIKLFCTFDIYVKCTCFSTTNFPKVMNSDTWVVIHPLSKGSNPFCIRNVGTYLLQAFQGS
jgi:hypothetical protein